MISKQLLLMQAKYNGMTAIQQERHYLQNLALIVLSNYNIVFKGGTYLWFCHNINRFSEDLDFTALETINEELITELLVLLKSRGVDIKVNDITNSARTLSFKLGIAGPLFNGNDRSRCFLWVEISKREKTVLEPEGHNVYFPYYDLEAKIIKGMDLNEVFAEKIRATLTREKARDIYDLYFLIKYKNIVPDINLINEKLKLDKSIFNKKEFSKTLQKKEKQYNTDLKGLIFGEIPDFKEVYDTIVNAFKD